MTKWLAVSLKDSKRKSGSRLESLLSFLADQSLKTRDVVREGTNEVFMKLQTSKDLEAIEAMVEQHPYVKVAYANS